MPLSPVSLIAIAVMLAALAVAWSRRFLAAGALAVANVLVFLLTTFGPRFVLDGGQELPVIHAELGLFTPTLAADPPLALLQVFTSMFVHADFGHLFGNMLVLLLFGLPFEERIGARRFLVVYLVAGLIGTLCQVAVTLPDPILLMGASGAIFGLIGAFASSYPNSVVPVPVTAIVITFFVRMKVWIGAILMGAIQLLSQAMLSGLDNVAYFAHLGGLAGGILLGWTLVKGKAPAHRSPVAVDLEALSPFARDAGTAAALTQMRSNHDEPQIFQAWLDRFFRTATCPTCKHRVMPRHRGEVVCTQGHTFDVRQDRRDKLAPTA